MSLTFAKFIATLPEEDRGDFKSLESESGRTYFGLAGCGYSYKNDGIEASDDALYFDNPVAERVMDSGAHYIVAEDGQVWRIPPLDTHGITLRCTPKDPMRPFAATHTK